MSIDFKLETAFDYNAKSTRAKSTSRASKLYPDTSTVNFSIFIKGSRIKNAELWPLRASKNYTKLFTTKSSYEDNIRVYPVTKFGAKDISTQQDWGNMSISPTPKNGKTDMSLQPTIIVKLADNVYIKLNFKMDGLLKRICKAYRITPDMTVNDKGNEVPDYAALLNSDVTYNTILKSEGVDAKTVKRTFSEVVMAYYDGIKALIEAGHVEVMIHKKSKALTSQDWITSKFFLRKEEKDGDKVTYPLLKGDDWVNAMRKIYKH